MNWEGIYMANPVAAVEKIVKLSLMIKDIVDTVRHNQDHFFATKINLNITLSSS